MLLHRQGHIHEIPHYQTLVLLDTEDKLICDSHLTNRLDYYMEPGKVTCSTILMPFCHIREGNGLTVKMLTQY